MYISARREIANDMRINGEMLIQNGVINARKKNASDNKKFTIFDVGANIGEWSYAMIEILRNQNLCEETDLYAFEPVHSTAETLKKNLPIHEKFLHIKEVALSSANGSIEIYFAGSNSGTNSLYRDSIVGEKQSQIIQQTTVMEFCMQNKIQHIHLLKCDTEGNDMEVLRGALPLLQENKISVFQFEYNHRWIYSRNFLRDVFEIIKTLPYKIVKLQKNHLLVFKKWHPELDKFFEGNYALIHEEAIGWFDTKNGFFDDSNSLRVV